MAHDLAVAAVGAVLARSAEGPAVLTDQSYPGGAPGGANVRADHVLGGRPCQHVLAHAALGRMEEHWQGGHSTLVLKPAREAVDLDAGPLGMPAASEGSCTEDSHAASHM